MRRFILRWKYTLSAVFIIIIPSSIMLFFPSTRKLGLLILTIFFITFIKEGIKVFRS